MQGETGFPWNSSSPVGAELSLHKSFLRRQARSWFYVHKSVFVPFSVPNTSSPCVLNWSLVYYFENNCLSPYFSQKFLFSFLFFPPSFFPPAHSLLLFASLQWLTAYPQPWTHPKLVNDTLSTSNDSPFASKMGSHFSFPLLGTLTVLLEKKYLLYLNGMHGYISLVFEQTFSGHSVNSCSY